MHPILFQIGDFYIGTYGVMIVVGMISGMSLGIYLARRVNIAPDHIYDLTFIAVFSGFIGARLLFILVELDEFFKDPLAMILSREGFVFAGGFILAGILIYIAVVRKKLPKWDVGDVAAPSLALGHAFGRVGCFLAGCCYGRVCPPDSFFAVQFPRVTDSKGDTLLSFAYHDHVQRGLIDAAATESLPVLPTQLFESAANFLICGVLLLLWRRRKFSGQIFIAYLMLYGAFRFCIEFIRGDSGRGHPLGGPLTTSQVFSLLVIILGIGLWSALRPRRRVTRAPRQA